MSFRRRIFLGFLLILLVASGFAWSTFRRELRPTGKQVMEETLVDVANLVAELVADDMTDDTANHRLEQALRSYGDRRFGAKIYGIVKNQPDLHLYITDKRGTVVFDSHQTDVGRDYSQWRDVNRTMRGEYGARSSRSKLQLGGAAPVDMHYMYVAAPIVRQGVIVGVVSVGKDSERIAGYQRQAERKMLAYLAVLIALAGLVAYLFGRTLASKITALANYADRAAAGTPVSLPKLRTPDLDRLAQTVASMRERLEGRAYIESYVQSLAHAMKSPLAGITAAAEILRDPLTVEQRQQFAAHIGTQSARLHATIELMLKISHLESEAYQPKLHNFSLAALAQGVAIDFSALVCGDRAMITEAVAALVENALAFAMANSSVAIAVNSVGDPSKLSVELTVVNDGPVIPDFAQDKIFDKFYSLPRPATGETSTGLGLPFAKLVAQRSGGSLAVSNRHDHGGVIAALRLPRAT
jgi:two-component system, OmpR family, sensor histidine kinase CreC